MNQQVRSIPLLSAASATGSAAVCQLPGQYCFAVNGTFGGCTVGLQLLGPDGTNWISVEDANGALAFTAAKAVIVDLPAGQYRATITGGSGVSISASLNRVFD